MILHLAPLSGREFLRGSSWKVRMIGLLFLAVWPHEALCIEAFMTILEHEKMVNREGGSTDSTDSALHLPGVDKKAVVGTANYSSVLADEPFNAVGNPLLKHSGKRKEVGISAEQSNVFFRRVAQIPGMATNGEVVKKP